MYCRTCHIHLQHTYYANLVSKYCTFKYTRKPLGEILCLCVRVFLRSKMVDPYLIACHCGFQNWFSSLNRRRCESAISKRRLFYPSVRRFGTQHAHTLRCPSSSGTAFCRVPINNSGAVDRFRIATRRINKISSPLRAAFTSNRDVPARSWSWIFGPPVSKSAPFPTYCAVVTSLPNTLVTCRWISTVALHTLSVKI